MEAFFHEPGKTTMRILNYLFLLGISINGLCQTFEDFPVLDERYLPELQKESINIYNGSSLYGYVNGGAALYKEYGFSALKVQKIIYDNCRYTIEIYRMSGKEEAFGIFSVSRFNCNNGSQLTRYTCQTPYQLQICSGSYYINIINERGKEADLNASQKIAKALLANIMESSADFTVFFPEISRETIDKHAVLVKGNLGVMNGVPELSNFLNEDARYTALILKDIDGYLISIRFFSINELVAFAAMRRWDTDLLSRKPVKMPGGEIVSMISENHLLVRMYE